MRHRGIQHQMRMTEIAKALAVANGEIHNGFQRMRRLEKEAAEIKEFIAKHERRKTDLLRIQQQLMETQFWTEFGLPPDLANSEFERITENHITS